MPFFCPFPRTRLESHPSQYFLLHCPPLFFPFALSPPRHPPRADLPFALRCTHYHRYCTYGRIRSRLRPAVQSKHEGEIARGGSGRIDPHICCAWLTLPRICCSSASVPRNHRHVLVDVVAESGRRDYNVRPLSILLYWYPISYPSAPSFPCCPGLRHPLHVTDMSCASPSLPLPAADTAARARARASADADAEAEADRIIHRRASNDYHVSSSLSAESADRSKARSSINFNSNTEAK